MTIQLVGSSGLVRRTLGCKLGEPQAGDTRRANGRHDSFSGYLDPSTVRQTDSRDPFGIRAYRA